MKKKPRKQPKTRKRSTALTIREDLDKLAQRVAALEARVPSQLEDGMTDAHAQAAPPDDSA